MSYSYAKLILRRGFWLKGHLRQCRSYASFLRCKNSKIFQQVLCHPRIQAVPQTYLNACFSTSCSVGSLDNNNSPSHYSGNNDDSSPTLEELIHVTKCRDEKLIGTVYKYCQRCLGGTWGRCSADKFSVKYLGCGMTNYVYLCSLDDDVVTGDHEPRKVVVRIFGSILDQKQRFNEGVIFTLLSERGYGPKTLGTFYSGRIEEFLPYRPLFRYEMTDPDISMLIARRAGEYHCMKLPLNKIPTLWEIMEKYLKVCKEVSFQDSKEQQLHQSIKDNLDLESEYQWLKQMLINLQSPVVFCHNDFQAGNILYINDDALKPDIAMIDFDYSSYNYRAFDIANHFCEYMYEYTLDDSKDGGFITHNNAYPSYEQQVKFAAEYIATLKSFHDKSKTVDYDHQRWSSIIDVCTVDELLHEVDRFALVSNFRWGLWSIVQQQESKIEFGYLQYGQARFTEYIRKKKELGY